jgi:hypothetical protein
VPGGRRRNTGSGGVAREQMGNSTKMGDRHNSWYLQALYTSLLTCSMVSLN